MSNVVNMVILFNGWNGKSKNRTSLKSGFEIQVDDNLRYMLTVWKIVVSPTKLSAVGLCRCVSVAKWFTFHTSMQVLSAGQN